MAKLNWKPGNMLAPVPAVMVSVGATPDEYNIITIAWTGTICSDPPLCYISIRPGRHSYELIKKNKEYVINLTTRDLAYATDWCGVRSGQHYNKFKEMNLTPGKAAVVNAPIIEESPVNIECIVKEIIPMGTHDMFISEIVHVKADDKYIDPETGAFHLIKSRPLAYLHGHYFELGAKAGKFGFSVEKKKRRKKMKKN
ncbi:MAG: flavin reductase family protein [Cytophagaceae bacterium]|jgi:flavin reductase (DIM6/NTAB) family NADH-FMN oxidoreductase RutF|nr:flavin reductase family protein [Cytophagaceae bacterium]